MVHGGLLAARLLARERPRLRRELLRRERGQPATRGREAPHRGRARPAWLGRG